MSTESGTEEKFWAVVASTVVYLITRSPSFDIEYKL